MDLIIYTLKSLAYIMINPYLILVLIMLGIMFFMKNRKLVNMQKVIMGESVNSPLELTLSQIVIGIFVGAIASLILSYLGVVFKENSGIELLFIISILLTFIKPRFSSFAYSASILGVLSLIFNYLKVHIVGGNKILDINITSLIVFVGIINIVEGILIMIDGEKGAVPVFSNKDGKIVGGYAFNRNWIVPVAIFIAYSTRNISDIGTIESIIVPNWWPILKEDSILNIINIAILSLYPFWGVIGYSSITFTQKKKNKVIYSGFMIFIYGISLSFMSLLCRFGLISQMIILLLVPVAYNIVLKIQNKIEDMRSPIFISNDSEICVLEVSPYSIAFDSGIRAGDKIISVNYEFIEDIMKIYKIVKTSIYDINMTILDSRGNKKEIVIKPRNNKNLGAVLVPKTVKLDDVVSVEDNNLCSIFNKTNKNK